MKGVRSTHSLPLLPILHISLQQSSISSNLLDLQGLQVLSGSIFPLADVLRDGDPVLPLQVLFMSWTEQRVQGDNFALPRRGEDMRQFNRIIELPRLDEYLSRAFDLRDVILGERDLGVAGVAAGYGPLGLAWYVPQTLERR
jgi:hypothetical protein